MYNGTNIPEVMKLINTEIVSIIVKVLISNDMISLDRKTSIKLTR